MDSSLSNDRPTTPPMDNSIHLRRSLGLVTSPRAPRRSSSSGSSSFLSSPVSSRFSGSSSGSPSRCSFNSPSSMNSSSFVNPFLSESDGRTESINNSLQRALFSDMDVSRFRQEFIILSVLGSGEFGCVFKCLCRINGMVYAVKRGYRPISLTMNGLNETFALAILNHPNIVRHHSSWYENGYLYMQNEYCNAGSLQEVIDSGPLEERTLWKVLEHVSLALKYIHSLNMAHLDVKPDNIFLHRGMDIALRAFDVEHVAENVQEVVFKLGDLGHLRKIGDEASNIDEGDVRYLAKEVLQDNYSNLTKADIFSLGMTVYEAAGGGPLPLNGPNWHAIRSGNIKKLNDLSPTLYNLILSMIDIDPHRRPSASNIILQCLHS